MGGVVLKAISFKELVLVYQVLHFETIILPIGKGINLLLVVSCQCVPFILILFSNGGEIARVDLSASDLIKGGLNFGFIIGNLSFKFLDVSLDQRVAVLNELALATVLAEVG